MARKRFGRNQKRRLREQIKSLRAEVERMTAENNYNRNRAEYWVTKYNRVHARITAVCANSALLDPAERRVSEISDSPDYCINTLRPEIPRLSDQETEPPVYQTAEISRLHKMEVTSVRDTIKKAGYHLILTTHGDNRKYAYYLTNDMLGSPESYWDELINHIGREFARLIVKHRSGRG